MERSCEKSVLFFVVLAVLPAVFFLPSSGVSVSSGEISERHSAVLELQPAGYWPADRGTGEELRDLSEHQNHGRIHHVPWDRDRGLLEFTSAYQWLAVPAHRAYRSESFSAGGWVFLRSQLWGGNWRPWGGMQLIGEIDRAPHHQRAGFHLSIRIDEVVDIVSGSKHSDVIGSRSAEISLPLREWQHVLYTYEHDEGVGSLYINGRLATKQEGVSHGRRERPLRMGHDSFWWLQSTRSGSLDGSLRDMVWFARALDPAQVEALCEATRPDVQPELPGEDEIVLRSRGAGKVYRNVPEADMGHTLYCGTVAFSELPELSAAEKNRVLQQLEEREAEEIRDIADQLMATLEGALDNWRTRRSAASLLVMIDTPEALSLLENGLPDMIDELADSASEDRQRAETALALAEAGARAGEAAPALAAALEEVVEEEGGRLPRVEDFLRNSLMRALLDTAPEDDEAREALGSALAKPLFAAIEMEREKLAEVKELADQGRYMDALDVYSELPDEVRGTFFTERQHRDYSPVAEFNDCTYVMGTGRAWEGVEPITEKEYEEILARLSEDYPRAADWRDYEDSELVRVPVIKTGPDGEEHKIYLGGEDFVLDVAGHGVKERGWSVFADNNGYIHIVGGQHNRPNSDRFIPGSWEKMGLSRDRGRSDFPAQLYWVSKEPECIDSFEFVGKRDNPRRIPVDYLNYMVFVQSNDNVTYLYGRADTYGWQTWGAFHYEESQRRWRPVGCDPFYVVKDAGETNPQWLNYLHGHIRGGVPGKPGTNMLPALVWSWQPAFYNFCRDGWGIRFDLTNRMHVYKQIFGLNEDGYNVASSVYAYSDDGGGTFHRADGSEVMLPLTTNPSPGHNACHFEHDTRPRWELWISILRAMGYNPPGPSMPWTYTVR